MPACRGAMYMSSRPCLQGGSLGEGQRAAMSSWLGGTPGKPLSARPLAPARDLGDEVAHGGDGAVGVVCEALLDLGHACRVGLAAVDVPVASDHAARPPISAVERDLPTGLVVPVACVLQEDLEDLDALVLLRDLLLVDLDLKLPRLEQLSVLSCLAPQRHVGLLNLHEPRLCVVVCAVGEESLILCARRGYQLLKLLLTTCLPPRRLVSDLRIDRDLLAVEALERLDEDGHAFGALCSLLRIHLTLAHTLLCVGLFLHRCEHVPSFRDSRRAQPRPPPNG
mmetsp:Transcript_64548/g.158886  ORF Transcript_64548/g.158886 Transcript_64548/m.158886 type:complete len:281 (-) Transcript_64548:1465-2307(-)